jgi:hypothetical protein
MPVYVRRMVNYSLVGNTLLVNTDQPSELNNRLQSLRVALDKAFDADDEDSSETLDDASTLVASSPQIYHLSTPDLPISPLTLSPAATPPTSPLFAPWECPNTETLPLMPPTPRIQPMEHAGIPTFELLLQRTRPSTEPVFVRGGNVFFGGR